MNSLIGVLAVIVIGTFAPTASGSPCNAGSVQNEADSAVSAGEFDRAVTLLTAEPPECRLWTQLFNTLALQHAFTEDSAGNSENEISLIRVKARALAEYASFLEELENNKRTSHVEPVPMLIELSEFELASSYLGRRIAEFDSYDRSSLSETELNLLEEKRELAQQMKSILENATAPRKEEIEQELLRLIDLGSSE